MKKKNVDKSRRKFLEQAGKMAVAAPVTAVVLTATSKPAHATIGSVAPPPRTDV
ncbi:MAG: hypothetical protein ABW148_14250 [Sedimenticola sp.]